MKMCGIPHTVRMLSGDAVARGRFWAEAALGVRGRTESSRGGQGYRSTRLRRSLFWKSFSRGA